MFEKLYSIKLPLDKRRQELYIKGKSLRIERDAVFLKKSQTLDFATYFNLFFVQKWKKYTPIRAVTIQLQIRGKYEITVSAIGEKQKKTLFTEIGKGEYQKRISLDDIHDNFIAFEIKALEDDVQFLDGTYYGEFDKKQETNIGISSVQKRRKIFTKWNIVFRCPEYFLNSTFLLQDIMTG